MSAGVAQGLILGPDIWNVSHDDVLDLPVPLGVYLVGHADDLVIVIMTKDTRLAQIRLSQATRWVDQWMQSRRLQLAMQKTELLYLTRKRIDTMIPMTLGTSIVRLGQSAKYLGVTLDTSVTFWPHIRGAAERAALKTAALAHLMGNMKGPRPSVNRLLMTHDTPIEGRDMGGHDANRGVPQKIAVVQRCGALRIVCAYRTVLERRCWRSPGLFQRTS